MFLFNFMVNVCSYILLFQLLVLKLTDFFNRGKLGYNLVTIIFLWNFLSYYLMFIELFLNGLDINTTGNYYFYLVFGTSIVPMIFKLLLFLLDYEYWVHTLWRCFDKKLYWLKCSSIKLESQLVKQSNFDDRTIFDFLSSNFECINNVWVAYFMVSGTGKTSCARVIANQAVSCF